MSNTVKKNNIAHIHITGHIESAENNPLFKLHKDAKDQYLHYLLIGILKGSSFEEAFAEIKGHVIDCYANYSNRKFIEDELAKKAGLYNWSSIIFNELKPRALEIKYMISRLPEVSLDVMIVDKTVIIRGKRNGERTKIS